MTYTYILFARILHALQMYSKDAEWEVCRWEKNYKRLSAKHKGLLTNHASKAQAARQGILSNQNFLKCVADSFSEPTLMVGAEKSVKHRLKHQIPASPADLDKARCNAGTRHIAAIQDIY